MSKTLYLICHTEYDGDLRAWEVHDGIVFSSFGDALDYINKKNDGVKDTDEWFYISEVDFQEQSYE